MKKALATFLLFSTALATAQPDGGDWDTYQMTVNGRPVSVMVDLSLKESVSARERPFALIIRVAIAAPMENGLPDRREAARLDSLEEALVASLASSNAAVYAGRFTQRGLRVFHFFSADTAGYAAALWKAFTPLPGLQWLARAVHDPQWSNYTEVLFPPPDMLERIQSRRTVERLQAAGDELKQPRRIDHHFHFPTSEARSRFVKATAAMGLSLAGIPETPETGGSLPWYLHAYHQDVPDEGYIERMVMPLWQEARRQGGRYDQWAAAVLR